MTRKHLTLVATAAALALVPAAGAATHQAKPKVKVPKSGSYSGSPRGKDMTLYVSGKSIELAAFSFKCANTTGRTSLNAIPLKKTKKGYKFGISAHGNISFGDEAADENGTAKLSGRFARDGKSAKGVYRVKSPRCHDTGSIKWRVKR
jgi:hypothetical protein